MDISTMLLRVQFVSHSTLESSNPLAEWWMPSVPRIGESFTIFPDDKSADVYTIKDVIYVPDKKAVMVYGAKVP